MSVSRSGLLSEAKSPKEESSLERAKRRAAELRGHIDGVEDSTDEFFVPPEIIPDGWTYEWKRKMVLNKEDPSYAVQLSREGWEAVPLNRCKRHRAMMPQGWDGPTIERHGMILMERPAEITQEYRNIELRRARAQVRQKEEQLSSTPDGTLTRNDPRVSPKIKKSYSPVEIPED
ncbi:MAG: hypothetical protein ABFD60_15210 [Bryobacteraceae bacterium]